MPHPQGRALPISMPVEETGSDTDLVGAKFEGTQFALVVCTTLHWLVLR